LKLRTNNIWIGLGFGFFFFFLVGWEFFVILFTISSIVHFASTSMKMEKENVKNQWEEILHKFVICV